MSEIYQSTKALSVYNVLSLSKRDLSRADVESFLIRSFDAQLPDDYVAHGAQYLIEHGLAEDRGGVLSIRRFPDGRGLPVVRSADNRSLLRGSY